MPETKRKPTPAQLDPTKTTLLRKRFNAELQRAISELWADIWKLVVVEDSFGLGKSQPSDVVRRTVDIGLTNERWEARTDPEKLDAFERWMADHFGDKLLNRTRKVLWAKFIRDAFERGALNAFDSIEQMGGNGISRSTTRQAFLRQMFAHPAQVDRVQMLVSRVLTDLKGIDAATEARMIRILADGFARGESPRTIARELKNAITTLTRRRALLIARSEVIRAHSEGILSGMEALGIDKVAGKAEWKTSGLDNVCPLCAPLEGVVMSIQSARGLIPRHPACACTWLPADVGENGKGQKRGKKAESALKASVSAEGGDDKSRWTGADLVTTAGVKASLADDGGSDRARRAGLVNVAEGLSYNNGKIETDPLIEFDKFIRGGLDDWKI